MPRAENNQTPLLVVVVLVFFYFMFKNPSETPNSEAKAKEEPIPKESEYVPPDTSLNVRTNYGTVQGIERLLRTGKSVHAYLGIPYATPPTGNLRFQPPLESHMWSGIRPANAKPKSCYQIIQNIPNILHWFIDEENEFSEDCLYLNIWTPSPRPKNAAVMVWIHGGGFVAGSGSLEKYDGAVLSSEQNVIIVNVNYRLSLFGYLFADSEEAPGNVAIMDQELAIRWVKTNIDKFGGDPGRITLFGESAGAYAVEQHMVLPVNQDSFQRAIIQSGTELSYWPKQTPSGALKRAKSLTKILNCDATNSESDTEDINIKCLLGKTANELIDAALSSETATSFEFGPIVDGYYITASKAEYLEQGALRQATDVLLGDTKQDGYFISAFSGNLKNEDNEIITEEHFLDYIKQTIKSKSDLLAELIMLLYTDYSDSSNGTTIREQYIQFATDFYFRCGMNLLADYVSQNKNKIYRYQFSHHPSYSKYPNWSGSVHGDEIDYIFGKPIGDESFSREEVQVSRNTMTLFTDFAKNGHVNGWPTYDETSKQYLEIGVGLKIGSRLQEKQCHFWNKMFEKLRDALSE